MFFVLFILNVVHGFKVPGSCEIGHFYEPSLMNCLPCPANASLVTSIDGFACSCKELSIPVGISQCKPCNKTEIISSDGLSCVPRKCQSSAGRLVCRKCPIDYISVTQNFDGSPMKEVQCVKCARGYKASNNHCTRCETCNCNKFEVIVSGKCIPKKYVLERPKYSENILHPNEVLEAVKLEYLCTKQEHRSCRSLASFCVRNHYTSHSAGPCRLWLQRNLISFKGESELLSGVLEKNSEKEISFPLLTIEDIQSNTAELSVTRGMDTLKILLATHTSSGGFNILQKRVKKQHDCLPPLDIKIGSDFMRDCVLNVSELLPSDYGDIFELYLLSHEDLKPLPIVVQKPNGYYVEKGAWTSNKFRKFFLINKFLSTTTNTTSTVYLRTLLLHVREILKSGATIRLLPYIWVILFLMKFSAAPCIFYTFFYFITLIYNQTWTLKRVDRDSSNVGSLRLLLTIEVQYSTKSPLNDIITTSIRVEHQMPDAGVLRSMEISGGVLVAIMVIYAVIQTRGSVRRGGSYVAIVPSLSSCIADALYFATCISALHALAAETGTLGLTLPLSQDEEQLISAIQYAVVTLKFVKVLWINWKQCRCDIIFIDWSQYNPSIKAPSSTQNNWKMDMLSTAWVSMQTKRRVSPSYTVTITLLVLYLISPWESYVPRGRGYKWVIAVSVWWSSYSFLSCVLILTEKLLLPHRARFSKLCTDLEISVLVFQEDYYGHYVNGRNDDLYSRSMSYSLASCRVVCTPQLRNVFVKIQTSSDFGETTTKHALLSRFLGAFFERALDGLNWIASERTILERLLDVEIIEREGGNTSVLLYDSNITTPSCFAVTWIGEEWTLATFDAMLFGSILVASDQSLLAALVTVIVWMVMKSVRMFISYWHFKIKT